MSNFPHPAGLGLGERGADGSTRIPRRVSVTTDANVSNVGQLTDDHASVLLTPHPPLFLPLHPFPPVSPRREPRMAISRRWAGKAALWARVHCVQV